MYYKDRVIRILNKMTTEKRNELYTKLWVLHEKDNFYMESDCYICRVNTILQMIELY